MASTGTAARSDSTRFAPRRACPASRETLTPNTPTVNTWSAKESGEACRRSAYLVWFRTSCFSLKAAQQSSTTQWKCGQDTNMQFFVHSSGPRLRTDDAKSEMALFERSKSSRPSQYERNLPSKILQDSFRCDIAGIIILKKKRIV